MKSALIQLVKKIRLSPHSEHAIIDEYYKQACVLFSEDSQKTARIIDVGKVVDTLKSNINFDSIQSYNSFHFSPDHEINTNPILNIQKVKIDIKPASWHEKVEFNLLLITTQFTLVDSYEQFLILSHGDKSKNIKNKLSMEVFTFRLSPDFTIWSYQLI